MKKLFLAFAMLAVLAGCSKDDSAKKPTITKLEVSLNIDAISSDILNYFNVEYTYVDFNNNQVTKTITKPETITFSISNPQLGEESSTPFSVQMIFTQKGTEAKASGTYDSTYDWHLDLDAYDKNGALVSGSGSVQKASSNVPYDNGKFSNFLSAVTSQAKISAITYKTFFCQTTSGEWHIGVDGTHISTLQRK